MELVTKKSAPAFLAVLLVLKLCVATLNAHLMPERQNYDPKHHAWRVRTAGLEMDKMAYNGPLYYLSAYPGVKSKKGYGVGVGATRADAGGPAKAQVDRLIKRVRYVNVAYLGAFYALWCFYLFRRVLPDWRSATVAATMLLALPGYQKMAALVHPDNLLTLLASVSFAGWIALESSRRKGFLGSVGLAIATGLTGLTRPFAAVPVMVHALLNVHASFVAEGRRLLSVRFVARTLVVTALTGALAVSWFAYRYHKTDEVTDAYRASYMEPYLPLREAFDYRAYYTRFHFRKLLEKPNRTMAGTDEPNLGAYGNSFPTIFYSEVWGDHWLYFSGRQDQEGKLWPKRLLFVLALPLSLVVAIGLLVNLLLIPLRAIRARKLVTPLTAALALAVGGIALFLYWQGGAGLLPGKNSTIKFVYVAYLVPFVLAVAFSFTPGRRLYNLLLALAIVTYVAAFPVSMFTPPPDPPAKQGKVPAADDDG